MMKLPTKLSISGLRSMNSIGISLTSLIKKYACCIPIRVFSKSSIGKDITFNFFGSIFITTLLMNKFVNQILGTWSKLRKRRLEE